MSFLSDTIDYRALLYALSRQSAPLPPELQAKLTKAQASELDKIIASYEPLEREYQQAIADLQQQYTAQERTKSIGTTFSVYPNFSNDDLSAILSSQDWVKAAQEFIHNFSQSTTPDRVWDRIDRIAVMTAGGAAIGGAIAQVPGAIIGAAMGVSYGCYITFGKQLRQSSEKEQPRPDTSKINGDRTIDIDNLPPKQITNKELRSEIPVWNQEEQQQRNQLAMEKLRAAIDRDKQKPHSPEAQSFFEEFQQLVDSDRPDGQKLFSK